MADQRSDKTASGAAGDTGAPGGESGLGGVLSGRGRMVDQVKDFAKRRPFAFAALASVIGIALLNTLRGKGGERR